MINSILDTDTYKLTMQQAIAFQHPRVKAKYSFTNRGNTKFPPGFAEELRRLVNGMKTLGLTGNEEKFLRERCYYLKPTYIDLLRGYRYDPDEVNIRQVGHELFVDIEGLWYRTEPWEVPLLATISELYYKMTNQPPLVSSSAGYEQDWKQKATYKFRRMSEAGAVLSDFGTRRRASLEVQDFIVQQLCQTKCGAGTSNVHLAHKYDTTPIGTMAHEWPMAHAALYGYRMATRMMLKGWVREYEGDLGIALPDTFTTEVFLRDFGTQSAKLFDGLRHDSGDWQSFTKKAIAHYESLRIDPTTKIIVYSDALDIDKALEIHTAVKDQVRPRFGIGTHLTNDVGRTPLNIVIKLTSCQGVSVVKLSDTSGKAMGSAESLSHCKYELGLQ